MGPGVTQNPCPPDLPPVKLRKLKWGLERTEKKTKIYGSIKTKLIQTSMEDKLLRQKAKKE